MVPLVVRAGDQLLFEDGSGVLAWLLTLRRRIVVLELFARRRAVGCA